MCEYKPYYGTFDWVQEIARSHGIEICSMMHKGGVSTVSLKVKYILSPKKVYAFCKEMKRRWSYAEILKIKFCL